jgi:hypothetical protein
MLELYLAPEQWDLIDTYEARISIVSLSKKNLVIDCENIYIYIPDWLIVKLPEQLQLLSKNHATITKSTLTIEFPEYLSIRAWLYSKDHKSYELNTKGETVSVTRLWGSPDAKLNHYKIWGYLDWPFSAIDEFVFAAEAYVKFSFDEADCQPIN